MREVLEEEAIALLGNHEGHNVKCLNYRAK